MCGRTACTLDPDDLRCACAYTNRKGQRKLPEWRQPSSTSSGSSSKDGKHHIANSGNNGPQGKNREYYPSTNVSPQSITPVLVSSKHFDESNDSDEQLLTPMQWGLVPSWHKGDPSQVTYKMNNCRSEGMMGKSIFKKPFEKGRRCVVLADGYYEWKTSKDSKTKQPFFIYMPQNSCNRLSELYIKSDNQIKQDPAKLDDDVEEDFEEWTGHTLLAMAGIFDCWIPPNDGEALYTYTIVTTEASSGGMADIHHRMPVILNGNEEIRDWLDFDTVPAHEAFKKLVKSVKCLQFHPVSSQVNNSRYKGLDCVKPIEIGKPPQSKSSNLMKSWLKKATPKKSSITPITNGTKMKQVSSVKRKSMMEEWIEKAKSPHKKIAYDDESVRKKIKEETREQLT
ncbi:abasic site processing protein HMCES-like [Antedon mediterranea]|uniref:abasic site processing protein HMCES-like n=1 Tax=Antedon mediterranea TaxID=105859 RepID=UPI003AF43CE6